MGIRHPNYQLVKVHFTYTVEEIAMLFGFHRNTVRDWIKNSGLPKVDDKRRPTLIWGPDLRDFLVRRRQKNKQRCEPGQIYCVGCREAVNPAENMADYRPRTTTSGNLEGLCPACGSLINRVVTLAKLEQVRGKLDIRMTQAP
jgi:hypothetical protein